MPQLNDRLHKQRRKEVQSFSCDGHRWQLYAAEAKRHAIPLAEWIRQRLDEALRAVK